MAKTEDSLFDEIVELLLQDGLPAALEPDALAD